jgi:hypothetical protein
MRINAYYKEQEKEQLKEQEKKKKTSKKKSAPKSEYESEFETLWAVYPRKINRAKALISYIKARKDKKYTYETIRNGLERYIEQLEIVGTEPEYIMHGSTFFNQERFNDEYNVVGLKKKPKSAIEFWNREFGGVGYEPSRNSEVVEYYSDELQEPF